MPSTALLSDGPLADSPIAATSSVFPPASSRGWVVPLLGGAVALAVGIGLSFAARYAFLRLSSAIAPLAVAPASIPEPSQERNRRFELLDKYDASEVMPAVERM